MKKRETIRRVARHFVPGAIQLLVIALLLVTGFVAYNFGARHGGGHATPTPAASAAAAPSSHPVDLDGDGIIYISPMHPQIQRDEPGDCPICGMELVATRIDDLPDEAWVGSAPAGSMTRNRTAEVQHNHSAHDHDPELLGYACAMNCLPPLEEAGPCPICGMEMQPVFEDDDGAPTDEEVSPRRMTMAPEAVALLSIQTTSVERRHATRDVRLVGQLAVDPRRRAHISANVGGRIDVLRAQFEGDTIRAGEELAQIYSPELLAVQEELLQAVESASRFESSRVVVESVRERLMLAGLASEQVDQLIAEGVARDQFTLRAPFGGTVITRYVEEGDYVAREARILTVADLGVLWAELEAFESDLYWLREGQDVALRTEAHPGRTFPGVVSWIDPTTRTDTRTTRIRVDVQNAEALLKPGMYVTAVVETSPAEARNALVIPASAPLITGRRALVYVMRQDASRPTFEGRELVLGPRVGDAYVVLEGLTEGELVVTNGAFQIDSALQIRARPSMMSPEGGVAMTGHEHHGPDQDREEDHTGHQQAAPAAPEPQAVQAIQADHAEHATQEQQMTMPEVTMRRGTLRRILPVYLELHEALAADDFDKAVEEWNRLAELLDPDLDPEIHAEVAPGIGSHDIEQLRALFEPISMSVIGALRSFGNPLDQTVHRIHCPMAFDWQGADWIQVGENVRNPYFGEAMYRCGTVEEEVAPQ